MFRITGKYWLPQIASTIYVSFLSSSDSFEILVRISFRAFGMTGSRELEAFNGVFYHDRSPPNLIVRETAFQILQLSIDPQTDVLRERSSPERNVRSKYRCSCVLQFTCRRGVCSVLHRFTSQVIHRSGFCKFLNILCNFFPVRSRSPFINNNYIHLVCSKR